MAYFYMDTDGGSDSNGGTSWADAVLTFETLITKMSAGDTGVIQGAAADTTTSTRTLTGKGTATAPCEFLGVKDGTTNEGASITTSDLCVRGTDTLPLIQCTGTNIDMTVGGGSFNTYFGLHFQSNRIMQTGATLVGCKIEQTASNGYWKPASVRLKNCEIVARYIRRDGTGASTVQGGVGTFANSHMTYESRENVELHGVDLSGSSFTTLSNYLFYGTSLRLYNCKLPTGITSLCSAGSWAANDSQIELIHCSDNTAAKASTSSYQDYELEGRFGTIDLETTAVRTGGADDGASGAWSLAMTPKASITHEQSLRPCFASPMMAVWVDGGVSTTLTLFFANDGGVDYNEDEISVDWFTVDDGDTAGHDYLLSPSDVKLMIPSSTAITDDATSTWGGSAANGQKISKTFTPGFSGWCYAIFNIHKNQATPDTVYLDPAIHNDQYSGTVIAQMMPSGTIHSYEEPAGGGGGGLIRHPGMSGGLAA